MRIWVVVAIAVILLLTGCVDGTDSATDAIDEDDADALEDADDDAGNDENGESDADGVPDGELTIHHIDVGQADSTLIVTPEGETILIDTGDWPQDGAAVIAYLEERGIDRIDHLVATHGHADHIGGHAAVIEHFETEGDGIGAAYDSGVPADSATYENYLDAIDEHDVELFLVEEGDELPLEDNLKATVLNPPADYDGSDLHYSSVAIRFEFGDFRYLTTGDAEQDAEQRMVDDWAEKLEADVYHAGHHGSSTSSTPAFMDAVTPEIAIVSSAYESQYGHPDEEVLERYDESGIETYWTGVHGDITVTTEGSSVDVETGESFSSDPADLLEEKPGDDTEAISPAPITGGIVVPVPG